jgi:hypothetical protein
MLKLMMFINLQLSTNLIAIKFLFITIRLNMKKNIMFKK